MLELQISLGYSALEAGAALVPVTILMLFLSSRAGALAQRIGPRLPMTIGPLVIAAGLLLFTRIAPGSELRDRGAAGRDRVRPGPFVARSRRSPPR